MSAIPVLQYLGGLGVFGFVYWLMDNIVEEFMVLGIHETGNAYDFILYMWAAIVLVYMIFGGWWVIRKYNQQQYGGTL